MHAVEVIDDRSSITTDALDKVRAAWGIQASTSADSKHTQPVLDFHNGSLIGVRAEDTLLRVFFGAYKYGDQAHPEPSDAWAGRPWNLHGTVAAL